MADLKSFAQPTNTTLYTDVVDTERGFHGAHATMVHNGYASPPVGAVNLDNPGGAIRSFTQWSGTAYASVILNSPNGYQATTYYLNTPNCYISQDIGTGNPGFQFDVGDFMDYNRTSNVWRVVMGGVAKVVSAFDTFFNYDTIVHHEVAGPSYHLVINSLAPVDQKRWRTDHNSSVKNFYLINDADTTAAPYDTISRSGMAITTRRLNEASGRLLVGQSITDDGVTALQTTSYSASNQPSLTGGTGNTSLIAPNASAILDITTRTLKGGVTVGLGSTRITAPVAGLYLLSGSVGFFNGAVKGSGYIRINKNDVFISFQGEANTVPNQGVGLQINLQIPLLANDFITIQVVNAPDAGGTNASATIRDISFTKIN